MVFSSLRSRNRHSANPNPRLHTGAHRNTQADPHTSIRSEIQIHKDKNIHNTHTRMCTEKEITNTLWQQDDGAHTPVHVHTLRNGLNGHKNPQHGCRDDTPLQADSPPPSPHHLPWTLSQDTNQNFTSTYRSDLQLQAPPRPPLLPAPSASLLGSPPSLVPLVVPAVVKTERCRHPLSLHPGPAPPSQSVSGDCDVTEGKRGEACTSPLTNQQRRWESGDRMPKKKPRKSSMPVKIEREEVEGGRNEEDKC